VFWLSILSLSALKGAGFTSVQQIRKAIDESVEVYSDTAALFEWTKRRVYQKTLNDYYTNLCD
jgi:hypothetical protein